MDSGTERKSTLSLNAIAVRIDDLAKTSQLTRFCELSGQSREVLLRELNLLSGYLEDEDSKCDEDGTFLQSVIRRIATVSFLPTASPTEREEFLTLQAAIINFIENDVAIPAALTLVPKIDLPVNRVLAWDKKTLEKNARIEQEVDEAITLAPDKGWVIIWMPVDAIKIFLIRTYIQKRWDKNKVIQAADKICAAFKKLDSIKELERDIDNLIYSTMETAVRDL